VLGIAFTIFFINSCKKDNSDTVQFFLTQGSWQLESLQVFHYTGDLLTKTDTVNVTNCLKQTFTFTSNNNCSYQNFNCISQQASGTWQIQNDSLRLQATVALKDSINHPTPVQPFQNSRLVNLGQYSLILETGSISPVYKQTDKRVIRRYGFVHSQ
jgi:hypothetical protein